MPCSLQLPSIGCSALSHAAQEGSESSESEKKNEMQTENI